MRPRAGGSGGSSGSCFWAFYSGNPGSAGSMAPRAWATPWAPTGGRDLANFTAAGYSRRAVAMASKLLRAAVAVALVAVVRGAHLPPDTGGGRRQWRRRLRGGGWVGWRRWWRFVRLYVFKSTVTINTATIASGQAGNGGNGANGAVGGRAGNGSAAGGGSVDAAGGGRGANGKRRQLRCGRWRHGWPKLRHLCAGRDGYDQQRSGLGGCIRQRRQWRQSNPQGSAVASASGFRRTSWPAKVRLILSVRC